MNQIITYLTFNGNCREAMTFYQQCLGGQLELQTIGDSPHAKGLPRHIKGFIVQATLRKQNLVLMGSDLTDEKLLRGNAVSILLECDSEEQIKTYYNSLMQGGNPTHPLDKTNWGALFGGLTDKYGNRWLFHLKEVMSDLFH